MSSTSDNTEKEMYEVFMLLSKVKALRWTDEEKSNLPKKYTETMVHIAYEKADLDFDRDNYYAILNGGGEHRKTLLKQHVKRTLGLFTWNYPVCDPPCEKRPLIGLCWYQRYGYSLPCGCAHLADHTFKTENVASNLP